VSCPFASLPFARAWRIRLVRTAGAALTAVSLVAGCTQSPADVPEPSLARQISSQCGSSSNDDFFFPAGTFSTADHDGAAVRRGYSAYLTAMHEPSLSCGKAPDEAYRFIVERSFDPEPVAIRVTRSGRSYNLEATALSGGTRGIPFSFTDRSTKIISEMEWQSVVASVQHGGFWTTPELPIWPHNDLILDGSTWLLEGRQGSGYHLVARTPSKAEKFFTDAGLLLLRLSGFPVSDLGDLVVSK
jgi:hypothetical protein